MAIFRVMHYSADMTMKTATACLRRLPHSDGGFALSSCGALAKASRPLGCSCKHGSRRLWLVAVFIFRNIIVPIPAENRVINHEKGLVFHVCEKVYRSDLKYNKDKRCIIGYVNDTDESTMNPNSNYVRYYPEEFYNASKNKPAPAIKKVGIYTMTLAISQQWSIYQALVDASGPESCRGRNDCTKFKVQKVSEGSSHW